MSAIDDLPPLREVIQKHELMAKKALGQNFLFDLNLTSRIARASGPLEGAHVIEIGPARAASPARCWRAGRMSRRLSATPVACPLWPKSRVIIPAVCM